MAIVVSVLAYLANVQKNQSLDRLAELEGQSAALADQASQLQAELNARGEPVPYFYTTPTEKPFAMAGAGALHAVDPVTGEDRIVATFPEGEYYQLYAHPRRGWDGRIFLSRVLSDAPSLELYAFNVENGTAFERVSFNDDLPFMRQAVALSPDQTTLVAVYDNSNDPASMRSADGARKYVAFNLLTGEREEQAIGADYYFASAYDDASGAVGLNVSFETDTCAQATLYRQDVAVTGEPVFPRRVLGVGGFCIKTPPAVVNEGVDSSQ